jgi:hypothetical protein
LGRPDRLGQRHAPPRPVQGGGGAERAAPAASPSSARPPVRSLIAAGRSRFYWVYFQEPGVAEAELERDVDDTFRRILGGIGSVEGPRDPNQVLMLPEGGGFLDLVRRPEQLPAWLSEAGLAVMVEAYRRTGFRGGLIDPAWVNLDQAA